MMKREQFEIARIYVPVKRRATLEPAKVEDWVKASTERAISGNLAINDLDKKFESVTGTPTILINGKQYNPSYDPAAALKFSSEEFLRAVVTAAGTQ